MVIFKLRLHLVRALPWLLRRLLEQTLLQPLLLRFLHKLTPLELFEARLR